MLIQLIITQILTFVGLIFILRLLFYRHLNTALKRLKNLQEENLIKETQLKEELQKAKEERLIEVEKGQQEAKALVETAKKDAQNLRENLEDQARQEAEKIISFAKEEVIRLKQNLASEIQSHALIIALKMIEYVFNAEQKEVLQRQCIDDVIRELETVDKEKFSVKSDMVKIISSFPLTEKENANLKKILSEKLDTPINLQETLDVGLISGLVIQIGELVIDGSLKNKLRKVIPFIKAER